MFRFQLLDAPDEIKYSLTEVSAECSNDLRCYVSLLGADE